MLSKFKLLTQEIKLTVLLALPISLGQLGHVLTGVADYTMLGHTNPIDMAGDTFSPFVIFFIMIFGFWFCLGFSSLSANLKRG